MRFPRQRFFPVLLVSFFLLATLLWMFDASPARQARAQTVPTPTRQATATHIPRPSPTPEQEKESEPRPSTPRIVPVAGTATPVSVAGAQQPLTVTVLGGDDPVALNRFLRHLLAGYGSGGGYVTVTIGMVPADFPIALTLPAEVEVVGGYVRRGDYDEDLLLLAGGGTPEALTEMVRQELLTQGYTVPVDTTAAMSGQVFLSNDFFMSDILCSPDRAYVIFMAASRLDDEPAVLRININRSILGDICSQLPADGGMMGDGMMGAGILPQLVPPPNVQVRSSGSSSGMGSSGNSVSADAELQTSVLSLGDIAAHYVAQLAAAGWDQLGSSRADAVEWSVWGFTDAQGNRWTVTFYIVQKGDTPGTFLATLRADAQQ